MGVRVHESRQHGIPAGIQARLGWKPAQKAFLGTDLHDLLPMDENRSPRERVQLPQLLSALGEWGKRDHL